MCILETKGILCVRKDKPQPGERMMVIIMKADCSTDIGPVRASNQDTCECGLFSPNSAWGIVCDGMGGANGGNVASAVAVEKIRDIIISEFNENMSKENLRAMMLNAVNRANDAVHQLSLEKEELFGMGTTVVLMIATKGLLHVVHVGDSRAYLRNEEGFCQLTMDHSYVQDLVNLGQITQMEARVHPKRNIITKVLGVHEEVQGDYCQVDFSPGDIAIACSDGLSNYMEDDLIAEYIDRYRSNGSLLARQLIQYAAGNGGADNITVAVIRND